MPNRKERYVDMQKYRQTRNAQRKRNYDKTATYGCIRWTSEHEQLVLEHKMTDRELSNIIGHSVAAIQVRRCMLKKKLATEEV